MNYLYNEKMEHLRIYDKYNSDSGNHDLSTEKIMPISTSFDDVLNFHMMKSKSELNTI